MSAFPYRPELDQFLADTEATADAGKCEGDCEKHIGPVSVFRVWNEGADWGYFAYCDAAQEEDERKGFTVSTPAAFALIVRERI